MPNILVQHEQSWNITITPGADEFWPLMQDFHGVTFEPHAIRIHIDGASPQAWLTIHIGGPKIKKDGTLSKIDAGQTYYRDATLPAWATEIIADARWRYGLQDEQLSEYAWNAAEILGQQ